MDIKSTVFLVKPGFSQPTEFYEVKFELVEKHHNATMKEIGERLDKLDIKHIIVENDYPNFIDYIKSKFLVSRILKRNVKNN